MPYSVAQLQQILRQAGWPEDLVVTMAAIGLAESSGNPDAINNSPPREYSVGLWQVNMLAWPQYSKEQLQDPVTNAQAALEIYQRQGLRAWGPYVTGIYQRFMPTSQAAYDQGSAGSGDYSPVAFSSGVADSSSLALPLLLAGAGLLLYLLVD